MVYVVVFWCLFGELEDFGGGFLLEGDFEKAQVADVEDYFGKLQALSWKIVLMACFKVNFWSCCDPFVFSLVCCYKMRIMIIRDAFVICFREVWFFFACLNVVFLVKFLEQKLSLTFLCIISDSVFYAFHHEKIRNFWLSLLVIGAITVYLSHYLALHWKRHSIFNDLVSLQGKCLRGISRRIMEIY